MGVLLRCYQCHSIYNMEPNTDEFTFDELRLQLHSFHRMNKDFKQISFDLFHIAVAKFSGPIATLRDRSVQTELSLPEEIENNVAIFSHKGKLLKKIPFSTTEKVITFTFTNDEIMIIVLGNGSYYMADPFRSSSFKQHKLGESFTSDNIFSCVVLNSKLYFLSTNKRIYQVKNIHQPVPKEIILLSIKAQNPVHFINLQENMQVTYLHESNQIYTWSNNQKAITCELLNDKKGGKLVHINRRLYNDEVYFLLIFHSPFRVWFSKAGKSMNYEVALKTDDGEMKRSKGRGWKQVVYHVVWLQEMAVVSNNKWVALVKIDGFKILRPEPGRICPEIDAIRIYAENNWIMRIVPENYSNLFSSGQDASLLELYGAFESYQKGEVISKQLLQRQRQNIEDQLKKIIEGACFSLQPLQQMRILKFAIFVKTYYCLNINLKELCDELRFINNLRCQYLNRSLTLKQFQYLKENEMDRLSNILLRYNLHHLAEIVGGGEKVYVHWAKCKIQKLSQDMALNEIITKFKSYEQKENRQISYIDIARYAMETGRYNLAQNLIQKEPNVEKKVTILLWMAVVKKDDKAFLQRAVDNAEKSLNSDIMFKVVREINKLPMDEKLSKMIEKNPLIKKHYLEYLQLKSVDKLKEYYFKNKSSAELGYLAIKEGIGKKHSEQSQQMIGKLLPVVNEAISNKKPNEFAAFLRKIRPKGVDVSDAQIDKFKDEEHPEYLAEILIDKGLMEQAVKVLYRVKSNNAYRFLEQMGKWKQSATLAKQRKDMQKLKQLLHQAPDDNEGFINQLITNLSQRR